MVIISACFLGDNCKYDGGNNYTEWIADFTKTHSCFPVCPEMAGGLSAPRPPAEIIDGRAVNRDGIDVTEAFEQGAALVWEAARKKASELGEEIEGAILKAKSPSCGSKVIYDGTFSHKTVQGDGIFVQLLKKNGINVISENDHKEDLL
ncbi:DUF523 domain-containing protein [Clostridium aminobutyricum]|uniref:DUF523 domain-containing protein n=1 Tax=Clostridium aminobutyricum TaxID=33953 RepID=A0A939DBH0_CLOAM|nr:DUF523 domain-containing protein [Clostridium aminobutyricum]MBN7774233.1 DUF523 domain-containing protein [Clostridium aminobutyricum]